MVEFSIVSVYVLKGLIAGIAGLGIALVETDNINRGIIFSNSAVSITAAYFITAFREKLWLMNDYVILLTGFLLTGFAIIAVINFLRNPEENNQLLISTGLFISAVLGVIIGFDMIILSFVSFMVIMLFSYLGRQFVRK
jgi:hypothetical protein